MNRLLLWAFCAFSLISCGQSTKITKSWKEPGATYKKSSKEKTLVMAMVIDDISRRVIEDQLVKRIGSNAVASYTVFTDEMLKTLPSEVFSDKIKRDKYKYVLLMRLADVEKETSYTPGTTHAYYGGYGMYYGYGASFYSSPGYYSTDKNYFVETTAFSVEPDKLLWSGTTKSVNPSKIDKAISDIANVVAEKMKSDGFIVK